MRIVWATDVHLDFAAPVELSAFYSKIIDAKSDIVLVTGDISNGQPSRFLRNIHDAVKKPIYFVLGNHDFYTSAIRTVRDDVRKLCGSNSGYWGEIFYLPDMAPISLSKNISLVGVDGWADGEHGNFFKSDVWLNDYRFIQDLSPFEHNKRMLQKRLGEIADDEAAKLTKKLKMTPDKVIVATHVPPFREAAWYDGKLSDDNWAPHFTCKRVGDAIVADGERKKLVLSGHTHGRGRSDLGHICTWTGGARYQYPSIAAVIEVDDFGVHSNEFGSFLT